MILEHRYPDSPLPALTNRPGVIEARGGLEHDRFFPQEFVNPGRRLGDADDCPPLSFAPRWWPPPTV